MIQAIIFDCFGVLLTENWLAFKKEKFGDDPDKLNRVTELNHLVDAGLLGEDDYIADIAALANITEQDTRRMLRSVSPNRPLIAKVAELKDKYKIGMLSNISSDWFVSQFASEELALFDVLTLSYQVGVAKPDPYIYYTAAEQLGVETAACLFIDDVEQNVTAANEIGMRGIVYSSNEQIFLELPR